MGFPIEYLGLRRAKWGCDMEMVMHLLQFSRLEPDRPSTWHWRRYEGWIHNPAQRGLDSVACEHILDLQDTTWMSWLYHHATLQGNFPAASRYRFI
jgi:hypothetical protein